MKKIIIPAIAIVTLAIAYYFVIFLPSQKLVQNEQRKQAFLFEKQTECKNICEKLYEDDKDAFGDTSAVMVPRYAYNENKNACFYSGGVAENPNDMTKRIVNCQTNEEVLTIMTIDYKVFTSFCDTCVSSLDEYEMKKKEYMGN